LNGEETRRSEALTKAKDKYAMYYNHQCEPAPVFSPGDKYGSMEVTSPPSDLHQNWLIIN
jgi:hypothetical protein